MMSIRSLLVLTIVTTCLAQTAKIYKMCVTPDVSEGYCNILKDAPNSRVHCVYVNDSVECALKMMSGNEIDFGVFTAEQALLIQKTTPETTNMLNVVREIRNQERLKESFAFEMVALVKASSGINSFSDLRGKKFCHPGFHPEEQMTDAVLKYFEETVINGGSRGNCDSSMTAVENELKTVTDFFGDSCRGGKWVPDPNYNKELQSKYNKSCTLCSNQVACTYNDNGDGSHANALECLLTKGDVAFVALQYVEQRFSVNGVLPSGGEASNYQYLCPNGTITPITSSRPCPWLQQPWKAVVATKNSTGAVHFMIDGWTQIGSEAWKEAFHGILLPDNFYLMNQSNSINQSYPKSLEDYLHVNQNAGRKIPSDDSLVCSVDRKWMRWCTSSSEESTKCNWLKNAAITHGIAPGVTCIEGTDKQDCFRMVKSGDADLIGIDTNFGYIARNTSASNLSPIFYQGPKLYKPAAVVKENGNLKTFSDLSNAKACFPMYGGLGWASFIQHTKNRSILPDECPYSLAVSKLLKEACAPGSGSFSNNQNPQNLCSLCKGSNNAVTKPSTCLPSPDLEQYFGDEGAIKCLEEDAGDIAIADIEVVREYLGRKNIQSGYRLLCQSDTLSPISNDNKDCILLVAPQGEILSRHGLEQLRQKEMIVTLQRLVEVFGQDLPMRKRTFHLIGPFNGTSNLLLKDKMQHLWSIDPELGYLDSRNYTQLMDDISTCHLKSAAAEIGFSIIQTILVVALAKFCLQ